MFEAIQFCLAEAVTTGIVVGKGRAITTTWKVQVERVADLKLPKNGF